MKIACIGNCQLESLAWYIKYLLPDDECWWFSFNKKRYGGYFKAYLAYFNEINHELLTKDFIDKVNYPHDAKDYIKSCDYIICLNMTPNASPEYSMNKIKLLANEHCKIVTTSNYYIDIDKYDETYKGMQNREKAGNIEITIDQIINQHNKNEMLPTGKHEPNHPPSNYFLKLLELICEHLNWQYFSKEDHDMFLKVGFPHGVNLK